MQLLRQIRQSGVKAERKHEARLANCKTTRCSVWTALAQHLRAPRACGRPLQGDEFNALAVASGSRLPGRSHEFGALEPSSILGVPVSRLSFSAVPAISRCSGTAASWHAVLSQNFSENGPQTLAVGSKGGQTFSLSEHARIQLIPSRYIACEGPARKHSKR
jgi:hypothetical protein